MSTPIGYNIVEQEEIGEALRPWPSWRCVFYDMVVSTQDTAVELLRQRESEHLCIVASHQTAPRGRAGRDWHQTPGLDVSFSVLIEPAGRYPELLLPLLLSAAAYEMLRERLPVEIRIKWPNDLLADGHKLGGILIEGHNRGVWIAGVGINVNQLEFPSMLGRFATSMTLLTGEYVERSTVLASLLATIARFVTDAEEGRTDAIITAYNDGLGLPGRLVIAKTSNRTMEGRLALVDTDGVRFEDGRVVALGEVIRLGPTSS